VSRAGPITSHSRRTKTTEGYILSTPLASEQAQHDQTIKIDQVTIAKEQHLCRLPWGSDDSTADNVNAGSRLFGWALLGETPLREPPQLRHQPGAWTHNGAAWKNG